MKIKINKELEKVKEAINIFNKLEELEKKKKYNTPEYAKLSDKLYFCRRHKQ